MAIRQVVLPSAKVRCSVSVVLTKDTPLYLGHVSQDMIEQEDWYDAYFTRDARDGHYCVECKETFSEMDAITHLMRVHGWDEVNFHADW